MMARISTPIAIIVGAVIIAAAILGACLIAPYSLTTGAPGTPTLFRTNAITGEVRLCVPSRDGDQIKFECD